MWYEGTIEITRGKKHTVAYYWVKAFEEASEDYGINGGKISKLAIRIDGKYTASYDRGWDEEPAKNDKATQEVLKTLLEKYN